MKGERSTQRSGLRRTRYTLLERGLAVEVHHLLAMALSHNLKFLSPVKHQLFSLNKSPRGKMELNTLSNLPLSSSKKPENQDTDEWFSRTTALDVEMFVFFSNCS